jgi:hypothetical protein
VVPLNLIPKEKQVRRLFDLNSSAILPIPKNLQGLQGFLQERLKFTMRLRLVCGRAPLILEFERKSEPSCAGPYFHRYLNAMTKMFLIGANA